MNCAAQKQWVSKRTPMPERFWMKVNIRSKEECWNWRDCIDTGGYGTFTLNKRKFVASRMAYLLHNGTLPDGMDVCHKCDNPACCNPNHLFIGKHTDNMSDAKDKHRFQRGIEKPSHKLTESQVKEIRRRYKPWKCSSRKLAREYGVTHSNVLAIVKRVWWVHIE